jgi:hypothetical protein
VLCEGATAHQTEEDAAIVENMVKGYIGESRTIILLGSLFPASK